MSEEYDPRCGEDRDEAYHASRPAASFRNHLHRKRSGHPDCVPMARSQRWWRIVHENVRPLAAGPQLRPGTTRQLWRRRGGELNLFGFQQPQQVSAWNKQVATKSTTARQLPALTEAVQAEVVDAEKIGRLFQ